MPSPARQHRTSLPSFADPSNSRLCSSGTGTSARARARQCWDSTPLGGHSTLNTGPRVTGDNHNQCYQARGAKSGHLVMKCSHESSAAWSLQSTIEECTITFRVLHGPSCSQCSVSMSQKVTHIMSGPLELLSLIMVFSYSNLSCITQSRPRCRRRSRAFLSS